MPRRLPGIPACPALEKTPRRQEQPGGERRCGFRAVRRTRSPPSVCSRHAKSPPSARGPREEPRSLRAGGLYPHPSGRQTPPAAQGAIAGLCRGGRQGKARSGAAPQTCPVPPAAGTRSAAPRNRGRGDAPAAGPTPHSPQPRPLFAAAQSRLAPCPARAGRHVIRSAPGPARPLT